MNPLLHTAQVKITHPSFRAMALEALAGLGLKEELPCVVINVGCDPRTGYVTITLGPAEVAP